jgi:membrane protein YdbS with pleckstrin-like domain
MQQDEILIKQAVFNPKVRKYIFIVGAWYLLLMIITIPLMIVWLCGFGQWLSGAFFKTLSCRLTNKNLTFAKGLVIHTEKTIPLENIQDISFVGGPILRWFGLTMIRLETAGASAHGTGMMSLFGIEDSENFKNLILQQREIVKDKYAQHVNQNDKDIFEEMKDELVAIKELLAKR